MRPTMKEINRELAIMRRVQKALDALEDDAARDRVLRFFVSRHTGEPMGDPGQL